MSTNIARTSFPYSYDVTIRQKSSVFESRLTYFCSLGTLIRQEYLVGITRYSIRIRVQKCGVKIDQVTTRYTGNLLLFCTWYFHLAVGAYTLTATCERSGEWNGVPRHQTPPRRMVIHVDNVSDKVVGHSEVANPERVRR